MEKPKCKICGERHWSSERCRLVERSAPKAPGFDRRAYMREYMRRWRKGLTKSGE